MDAELESMVDRADELIGDLEYEYKNCLKAKNVTTRAQNLTHEVLEKLRHALDHAMWRAWDKYVSPHLSEKDRNSARVYFPIVNDLQRFRSTLGRGAMKDLDKIQKNFYEFVLNKQPFSSSENNWLDLLNKIAAEGKHIKLAPQRLIEIPQGEEKWVTFVLDDHGFFALALCKELSQKTRALLEEMITII